MNEALYFFIQHLNGGTQTKPSTTTPPLPPPRTIKDDVFIIESLSSKKIQDTFTPPSISNSSAGTDLVVTPQTFITEIRLTNIPVTDHTLNMNEKILSKILSETLPSPEITDDNRKSQIAAIEMYPDVPTSTMMNSSTNGIKSDTPVTVEGEYIPRNAEIRFTTSTYQSPVRQFEKRHSHIDQIRSNFERQHTSEIPIPIRKLSTPSTPPPTSSIIRASPSKIPVLHSQKSSDNLLKNNNGPIANRVSVSVTSIKNSSRNPSGK